MKNKKAFYRRAYERQNQVLLGSAGVLLGAIFMIWAAISWGSNQGYMAKPGELLVDGGKKLVTEELLEYLGRQSGILEAYPMISAAGEIETQEYVWRGTILGIPLLKEKFSVNTEKSIPSGNQALVIMEKGCLKAFQKEEKILKEEEQELFLEKAFQRGIQLKIGEEEKTVWDGQLAGISDQEQDKEGVVYTELSQLQMQLHNQGMDAEVHKLLLTVSHIRDGESLLQELKEIGFNGENPYEKEIEARESENGNYARYFCISLLLLVFSLFYLKQILFT